MADLEIIAVDVPGNELQAPEGADRYLAKKAIHLQEPLTTDSTIAGRNVAVDGALAATALQPGANLSLLVNNIIASQGEAESGSNNTQLMTPLRVAQAIAILAAGVKNNYTATTNPTTTDDVTQGYTAGSTWINKNTSKAYRCVDPTTNLAVWVNTTLSTADLMAVALSGSAEDLIEGATKKLLTIAERALIASAIQPGSSALPIQYGIITTEGNLTAEAVTDGTPRKVTSWNANGLANGITPDHTTDRLTINVSGVYSVSVSASFMGTANKTFHLRIFKNGITTNFVLDHKMDTGGDLVAVSLKGLFACVPGDYVEIYHRSTDGGSSFTLTNGQILLVRVGN